MASVCQNVRLERELLIYKIHQTHPLWGFTALFGALVFLRSFDGFLQFWIQAMTHLCIPLVLSFRYLFRYYLLRFYNIVPVLYATPRLVKYFVQLMVVSGSQSASTMLSPYNTRQNFPFECIWPFVSCSPEAHVSHPKHDTGLTLNL